MATRSRKKKAKLGIDVFPLTVSFGEYTYATDKLMEVRIARLSDVPEHPMAQSRNADLPWWKQHDQIPPELWNQIPSELEETKCLYCGDIIEIVRCPCWISLLGRGHWGCLKCQGQGQTHRAIRFECSGKRLSKYCLWLLKKHFSNPQIAPGFNGPNDPCLFRFDGGIGFLHPLAENDTGISEYFQQPVRPCGHVN